MWQPCAGSLLHVVEAALGLMQQLPITDEARCCVFLRRATELVHKQKGRKEKSNRNSRPGVGPSRPVCAVDDLPV